MSQESNTWHIYLSGLVQGVGFRPFVYNLALEHHLNGWVNNDVDGLHIVFNGSKIRADQFYNEILSHPPYLAQITSSSLTAAVNEEFQDFQIIHQSNSVKPQLYLTPDFALCHNCSNELKSITNRRYNYPFITCSECGPRYSIIGALPYDRENTVMDGFEMCENCRIEYSEPTDRRYYSQTNSCGTCGIQLALHILKEEVLTIDNEEVIRLIVEAWSEDKIVAVKGIGGYLITCDASSADAIATLRNRKNRPDKPLALMYPDLDSLKDFELSTEEKEELSSPVSPIVLAYKKGKSGTTTGICDGLSRVGIMLPYAPIFRLLLGSFVKPIVATSGNIHNSPIIYSDEKALDELFEIADLVLVNNREIVTPQDDSVVVYSTYFKKKIILRRSRGIAPSYYNQELSLTDRSILAMGGQLKSTFAALSNKNLYVSQYLGDLESYDTEESYSNTLLHLIGLLDIQPELIIVDSHPNYRSSLIGAEMAKDDDVPVLKVQHHLAHFSSLLGEHAYIASDEKVLGVIWDGTGLGTDGNIWGGEFFLYENLEFQRVTHLTYFYHFARDKMAKEPRLSALSLCKGIAEAQPFLLPKFTPQEWKLFNQMLSKSGTLKTSSVGRLFDGVASLLGICDSQSYEGQAASLLQVKAEAHFQRIGLSFNGSYFKPDDQDQFLLNHVLEGILSDMKSDENVEAIAAKFHLTLVHWIKHVAVTHKTKKIGFSGGVFQNTLLIDLIIYHLDSDFELLFHRDLSPNDENISFGQIIYAEILSKRAE